LSNLIFEPLPKIRLKKLMQFETHILASRGVKKQTVISKEVEWFEPRSEKEKS